MDPSLMAESLKSPKTNAVAIRTLLPCATCKKAAVSNFGPFKNCSGCREINRKKSQLAVERKRQRRALNARTQAPDSVIGGGDDDDDDDDEHLHIYPLKVSNENHQKAPVVKKKVVKHLRELEDDEQRVALKQMKNRLEASMLARKSTGSAANMPSAPHNRSNNGKEYQTASALYDSLKRRMQNCAVTQKKLKFQGYHAIVAVSSIDHAQRVEIVANDLRKIARLSFDHTKSDASYNFETMARTTTFKCTCLGQEPPKPVLKGNAGDLLKMARYSAGVTTPRICGGKVIVTAVDDGTHTLRILGQRIIVRVEHN